MNCHKCGNKATQNGKTKSGTQKYICKNENCKFSFTENYGNEKIKYTKTEQRLLAVLLSFLDVEPDKDLPLKHYLEKARTSSRSIKNITLKSFAKKINEPMQFSTYDAFMLISTNGNNITLTKFTQPILDAETANINNGKIKIKNFNRRLNPSWID